MVLFLFIFTTLFSSTVFARSGCCSHHGGVSGCGCADGTPLSSTCLPYYPECSGGGGSQQGAVQLPTKNIIVTPEPTVKLKRHIPTSTPIPTATLTPTITPPITQSPKPTTTQKPKKKVGNSHATVQTPLPQKNLFMQIFSFLFGIK
jgi:hypothetical protein